MKDQNTQQNPDESEDRINTTPAKAARRQALKRTLGGGAVLSAVVTLPGKWTRPVVNAVMLPAHAQTSVNTGDSINSEPIVCPDEFYDFSTQKMWEVTWGYDFANRNGGFIFDAESYGGLVSLDGGPVPDYIANYSNPNNNWHWLYVVDRNEVQHEYEFDDGTVWTVEVTFPAESCQPPTIVWAQDT